MRERKVIIFILVVSVISNMIFVYDKIQKRHDYNRFIKYNFTGFNYLLINSIHNLNDELFDGKVLKVNDMKRIRKIISAFDEKIYKMNFAIKQYQLLNDNFKLKDINLNEFHRYIINLERLIDENNIQYMKKKLDIITQISDLAKESTEIYNLDYYDSNGNKIKKVLLPEATKKFFDRIDAICKKANEEMQKN